MKKSYVKPVLVMEHFAFSQTVASGCGYDHKTQGRFGKPNHYDIETCGWRKGALVYFLDTKPNICQIGVSRNSSMEGICYDHPNGGVTIFGS